MTKRTVGMVKTQTELTTVEVAFPIYLRNSLGEDADEYIRIDEHLTAITITKDVNSFTLEVEKWEHLYERHVYPKEHHQSSKQEFLEMLEKAKRAILEVETTLGDSSHE